VPATGSVPADVTQQWEHRYQRMALAWRQMAAADRSRDSALVTEWTTRLADMRACQQKLVNDGRWRGGPRTLLAALELQNRELAMTAGLAWLLRPDGHHGLGPAVLDGLLERLEIVGSGTQPGVRVVLEEQREETRADLVVYGGDWTIVVEAKTFAVEQKRQLDRLHAHWSDEPTPCFVFLTRGERLPLTAVASRSAWRGLTWREIAEIGRTAAEPIVGVAPGVHDYIATLEAYHRA
jgi:hypothetical protein